MISNEAQINFQRSFIDGQSCKEKLPKVLWRNTLDVQSYLRDDLKKGKEIGKRKFFPNLWTKIEFGWDAHREQVLPSGVLPKLRFFLNLVFIQNPLKLFKTHPNQSLLTSWKELIVKARKKCSWNSIQTKQKS